MAANANGDYKMFKYYEGLCSSANFPKEIAKVLALGVKSEAVKDIDGNVIEEPFVHKSKNWDIVYPTPDTNITYITKDGVSRNIVFLTDNYGVPIVEELSPDDYTQKILNQVNKISDTVILKTTTDEKTIDDEEVDDLTVDATSNSKSLTMYLEIYKPTYVANPEEYPLDCEREGIIPKLITKDIYEQSMQTSRSTEEAIYMNSSCCTESSEINRTNGSIVIDSTTCISYLNKICKIYNDDSKIQPPSGANGSVNTTIDSTYLAKIKQEDVELYTFILNNLGDGEGIEPKDYTQLTELLFEVFKVTDDTGTETYTVQLLGSTALKIYEIKSGAYHDTAFVPNATLTPEYYLDGIYTPLETSLYHVADSRITFDENIKFTASIDGVLVVRYTYDTSTSNIISERKTMLNNHYVLMRLFDNISPDHSGPAENIYNSSGDITQTNSHISPWSKLSWYNDFEEIMIDTIDNDVSINSIQDGTVFVPLETVGLNADTKMRYWINTNNNRFSIIVMGNPSLDYERDRHIISACYCGRIDSFDNSINDTAGNFALFTCSSTEPCNTVLSINKNEKPMQNYILDDIENYDSLLLRTIMEESYINASYTQGRQYYDIQLPDKVYFDRTQTPKYIIVKDGKPLTTLKSYDKEWRTTNGKTDLCTIELHPDDINNPNITEPCTIYFYFGYYEETYAITSGVARDVFGNVIDVSKVDDYGINTSDGVTSIMMYHTRSKAYYQKHHMMFATTEEYMSKVMYGKSSYTGEYYADRIKVTHGNDGPRGTLSDLLVIDSSSLYALDELVINKDFEKDPDEYEETFVYFPITASYSPLSDSPNARYGIAIKKAEVEPIYEDEVKLLSIAVNQLQGIANDAWFPVYSDITPLQQTNNGCNVYWKIVENSGVVYDKEGNSTYSDYIPVKLVVTNNSHYMGDITNPIQPITGVTLAKGSQVGDGTNSYVVVNGFTPTDGEQIYYGISDANIASFGGPEIDDEGNAVAGTAAQLKAILFDGALDDTAEDDDGGWEYGINGVPYTDKIGSTLPSGDLKIVDAAPEKYLVLYSAKEEVISGETRVTISKFACVPLKNDVTDNDLLQYPCTVNVLCNGGDGTMRDNYGNEGVYINTTVSYNSSIAITFVPGDGYTKVGSVYVNDELSSVNQNVLTIDNVKEDTQIKVTFE